MEANFTPSPVPPPSSRTLRVHYGAGIQFQNEFPLRKIPPPKSFRTWRKNSEHRPRRCSEFVRKIRGKSVGRASRVPRSGCFFIFFYKTGATSRNRTEDPNFTPVAEPRRLGSLRGTRKRCDIHPLRADGQNCTGDPNFTKVVLC